MTSKNVVLLRDIFLYHQIYTKKNLFDKDYFPPAPFFATSRVIITDSEAALLFTVVLPKYCKTAGFACGSCCSLKLATRFTRGRLLRTIILGVA